MLLFGLDSWSMLEAMSRAVEGTHIGFLRKTTRKIAQRTKNGTWETLEAGEVLRVADIHTYAAYMDRKQGTVAQWGDIHQTFEVCAWEHGFEGVG